MLWTKCAGLSIFFVHGAKKNSCHGRARAIVVGVSAWPYRPMKVEDDTADQFHNSAIDLRILPNKNSNDVNPPSNDEHSRTISAVEIDNGTPCRSDENSVLVVPETTSLSQVDPKSELFMPSSTSSVQPVSAGGLKARKSRLKNAINRNPTRMLMRDWLLEQAASGNVPGLKWLDRDGTLIQIPWIHASKTGWSRDNHCRLFENWAIYTGQDLTL